MNAEIKKPDWAGNSIMPHDLLEKIIDHAIDADFTHKVKGSDFSSDLLMEMINFKQARAGHYARVCRGWKAAIFGATRSFKQKNLSALYLGPNFDRNFAGEQLINEGFLSVISKVTFAKNYTLPEKICDFAHGSSIEEFNSVQLNDQSDDDGNKLITLLNLSKKARFFHILGEVGSQNDVKLLWKLLRAMVHCNERPKEITCSVLFTCQPDWSFVDDDAGNLEGRIEKLDLSTCQFRAPGATLFAWTAALTVKVNLNEPLAIIDAPDWSALAHSIGHVEVNPTILNFVSTVKAQSLRINTDVVFEMFHPEPTDDMQRNISWGAVSSMQCDKVEIQGSVKTLADRVRNDSLHLLVKHNNLHFRFEEPFVKRETNWDSEPHLRKLVSSLQSSSSFVKTLTYPYEDKGYYQHGWLPIPETSFDCNEGLWKKMNDKLFELGKMEALDQIDDSETDSEMDAYDTDSDIVDDTDAEDQNESADMDTDMD